ncbi:TatD family hydrolase [Phocaeicola sp.]
MLLDIHTHHRPTVPGESILNVEPRELLAGTENQDVLLSFHCRGGVCPPECIYDYTIRNVIGRANPAPTVEGYYSVGIHPWRASEAGLEEWESLEEAVKHPAVLAIGEAGLDKLTSTDFSLQREVFIKQIFLSESVEKPLVIHCVKAFNELIELKKKYRPRMPWVVHGFRNNLNIARRLMNEDIYLSLGEKYQADVLQSIPLERLLTETDESVLGIHTLIERMAEARGLEANDLCNRIDQNARKIFFKR